MDDLLPHRGAFGAPRPQRLRALPLPPGPMPAWRGGRPLKRWRYVACFDERLMLCAADVRVGPGRQLFWAVWDRAAGVLRERTHRRAGAVVLDAPGRLRICDGEVEVDVELGEQAGVEAIWRHGHEYVWTRKQGGVGARGHVRLGERELHLDGRAIVDDTAGYHARRTGWFWSAGVGVATDGRELAWNLVEGLGEPESSSERSVWVDGVPFEPPPVRFAPDLSAVGELRFSEEARRVREENLLLVRSHHVHPFGTVAGTLPGVGVTLASGLGVMERHEARW